MHSISAQALWKSSLANKACTVQNISSQDLCVRSLCKRPPCTRAPFQKISSHNHKVLKTNLHGRSLHNVSFFLPSTAEWRTFRVCLAELCLSNLLGPSACRPPTSGTEALTRCKSHGLAEVRGNDQSKTTKNPKSTTHRNMHTPYWPLIGFRHVAYILYLRSYLFRLDLFQETWKFSFQPPFRGLSNFFFRRLGF